MNTSFGTWFLIKLMALSEFFQQSSGICQFSTTTVLEFTVLEFNFFFFFFPEFEVIYILIKFSFALKQYFF